MPDGISIKVTAETADLSAKLALAQADMRAFGTETRTAAEAMRAAGTGASAELRAGLERAAMAAAQAKAQVAQLRAEMNETSARGKAGMADLRAGIDELARPLTRATAAVGALGEIFVAGFGLERLGAMVERAAQLGETLDRLSQQTGVSVENLSGLRYAAEQSGLAADDLDRGLRLLGRNVEQALAQPTGLAARAFGVLGISAQDLEEHSNDLMFVLRQVADAFHDHAAGAQAEALAMAVFGRSGAALIPVLQQGSAGIEAMIARQKALGDQMTGPMAAALAEHRRAINDVETAWGGLVLELTASVAPALTRTAHALAGLLANAPRETVLANAISDIQARIAALKEAIPHENVISGWLDEKSIERYETRLNDLQIRLRALRSGAPEAAPSAGAAPASPAAAGGGEASAPAASGGAALPQFGDIPQVISGLSQFQAKLAQVKADMEEAGASNAAILQREVGLWQQEVGAADLTAQQKIQAERSYQQARIQLMQATGSDAIALARGQAEAIAADAGKTKSEQLASEAGVWQALLAGTRMSYEQRIEATRSLNQTLAELGRQRAADAKHNADEETKALSASYRQITEEAKKNAEELKKYMAEVARSNTQDAKQTARDWNDSFNAVEGAAKTVLDDVITRHETLAQAGQQAVQKLVLSWIDGLAEIMVKLVAFEALRLASGIGGGLGALAGQGAAALGGNAATAPTFGGSAGTPATGLAAILPGGLASMLGIGGSGGAQNQGMQQLQQAVTANTTATTTNTGGIVNWVQQQLQSVAQFLGLTTATTTASVASTAQATATTGNTLALTALSTVAPVGAAAIVAALAAETATLSAELMMLIMKPSFLGTSFDVGTMSVPQDMVAMVHQGEMIIPPVQSAAIRSGQMSLGGGGGGGGASGAPAINLGVTAMDGRSVMQVLNNPSTLRSLATGLQRYMAFNPSTQGAY